MVRNCHLYFCKVAVSVLSSKLEFHVKVVHPVPGNATGTLVNGILHHCSLPTPSFQDQEFLSDSNDLSDNELDEPSVNQTYSKDFSLNANETSIDPGIVHRLKTIPKVKPNIYMYIFL